MQFSWQQSLALLQVSPGSWQATLPQRPLVHAFEQQSLGATHGKLFLRQVTGVQYPALKWWLQQKGPSMALTGSPSGMHGGGEQMPSMQ